MKQVLIVGFVFLTACAPIDPRLEGTIAGLKTISNCEGGDFALTSNQLSALAKACSDDEISKIQTYVSCIAKPTCNTAMSEDEKEAAILLCGPDVFTLISVQCLDAH